VTTQNDEQLLVGDDAGELGERWQEIQARFVDDPREAVHDADALVQDVLHRVTRGETLICEGTETRVFVRRDADNPDRLRAIPVPDDIRALCE